MTADQLTFGEPEPLTACETCDGAHTAGEPCGMLEPRPEPPPWSAADDEWVARRRVSPELTAHMNRDASAEVEGAGEELTTEHARDVREILRRAGLSMASELRPAEVARAREAVELFRDPRTRSQTIREYIMPPRREHGGPPMKIERRMGPGS